MIALNYVASTDGLMPYLGWVAFAASTIILIYVWLKLIRCRKKLSDCERELIDLIVKEQSGVEEKVASESIERVDERGESEDRADERAPFETVGGEIVAEYADSSMTNSDRIFLSRLTGYIEKNIDSSELVVNSLCDFMGVTPLVLNKKLKSLVNMTANNFIRIVRLRRAAMLLRTARYTVSDVTYDVGFSDLRYFRECFKREFGVLPQEYKDQNMIAVVKGDMDIESESN